MNGAMVDTQARRGRILDGRVRLEERLGEGTMGDVWRATHLELGEEVAVKLLAPRLLAGASRAQYVAAFLREASLAGRVDSPHVVHVKECAFSLELGPYIVMERLEGLDLFEHIARSGTLETSEAITIVAQLGMALEALHAADVFHRDVKPENVVVTMPRGRPCATLIDFSIARRGAPPVEPVAEGVCGTPAYLSPERLLGTSGGDAQGDLWALGVVAYQCLVGRVPFDDRTLGTICVAVNRGAFVSPSAFVAGLPGGLDAWFQRTFARAPGDRYASATEMREALIAACSPLPLETACAVRAERTSGVRSRCLSLATRGQKVA